MRDEDQIQRMLLHTAESDSRIRAVVLQGSRANPEAPRDEMMDYDVVYVVDSHDSLRALTGDLSWLDHFGERVIRQTADDQLDWNDPNSYICMTQYADGVRVDVSFCLPDAIQHDFQSGDHDPSVVWLDKDGVLTVSPDAGHRWHVEPPDERRFQICCNEFWWLAHTIAKGLWRRELPYAQHMAALQRTEILHMAAWYIGSQRGYSVSVGKYGKYLEKYLPPALWLRYTRTYAGGEYTALWKALCEACELFRMLAHGVAAHTGYVYPRQDDERVSAYLRRVQTAARDRQRKTTCAFTGRRPQALPWGLDDGSPEERTFAKRLRAEIKRAYDDGYRIFLCGMAQGIDLLACEQTLALQEIYTDIRIIAALPGKNQTKGWPSFLVERYHHCLEHCNAHYSVAEYCSVESYHRRNRWMVDRAGRLIAVWEGEPSGGTGRTVQYAVSKGVEVVCLWPD